MLVDKISSEIHDIGASFPQCRCIISQSLTSSKLGHLDLLFKITELFIEHHCGCDFLRNTALYFISVGVVYHILRQVQNWVILIYFPSVIFCLVDRITPERLNMATSFLQYKCILSSPSTGSKLGYLNLLLKVWATYRICLWTRIS